VHRDATDQGSVVFYFSGHAAAEHRGIDRRSVSPAARCPQRSAITPRRRRTTPAGLSAGELDALALGAQVHDIGKLGVAAERCRPEGDKADQSRSGKCSILSSTRTLTLTATFDV
jgi:hypothetical protein